MQLKMFKSLEYEESVPKNRKRKPHCSKHRFGKLTERAEALARPTSRRLRSLWEENCAVLPPDRLDKIKSALEEDYFLSPEQTERYFQTVGTKGFWIPPEYSHKSKLEITGSAHCCDKKPTNNPRLKEMQMRRKWLIDFSAQVAFRLCDYIGKENKDNMLVSNRLRSIADVVLERVSEILGEAKPTRTNPGRLARFMVAISDRIAVWIENAVYRADAAEFSESEDDEHIPLDKSKIYTDTCPSNYPRE